MKRTEWRLIRVRLREAPIPAESNYAGVGATKKAGEKTSQAVCFMTEMALVLGDGMRLEIRGFDAVTLRRVVGLLRGAAAS